MKPGWRLTTGGRMLLILTAALLPLGLIALFASIESAQTNRLRREAEARDTASLSAGRLGGAIGRISLALREATAAMTPATSAAACRDSLDSLRLGQRFDVRFAAFAPNGRLICKTEGFAPQPAYAPDVLFATEVRLVGEAQVLRFEARGSTGGAYGIGEFPLSTLRDVTRPAASASRPGLLLSQGVERVVLATPDTVGALGRHVMVSSPVAGGQVQLELTTSDLRITAIEVLIALLPILMWLAAALIGWLVVNRLMIRPLLQLQRAVETHRAGDGALTLPRMTTPAREIRDLGHAFQRLTGQISHHEGELEEGLARQTKLTREVHHRVKNNLQVVSSLINLHARGVANLEVAAAYASIQRRVDALAVVHRNHYAELEENRGVGLRALIGELASNLRATAPPEAAHLAITLDLATCYADQDVAVPIAFLITEIVEIAIICTPTDRIAIELAPVPDVPRRALLTIGCRGLSSEECCRHPSFDRFTRICDGLARQLRAKLERDLDAGTFAIEITILAVETASS